MSNTVQSLQLSGVIQRDSSVKLCDFQYILNVKIVLIITFFLCNLCPAHMHFLTHLEESL